MIASAITAGIRIFYHVAGKDIALFIIPYIVFYCTKFSLLYLAIYPHGVYNGLKNQRRQGMEKETKEILVEGCCCHRTKHRSEKEYKDLIHRLNRIEGQIRGIKGMVERECYCPDILVQAAAVSAALNAFNRELLSSHIRSCVAENVRAGNDEVIDELLDTLKKLMK